MNKLVKVILLDQAGIEYKKLIKDQITLS